nr:MAG TPA: hypothetical protein [Caudoviricetes sp.]
MTATHRLRSRHFFDSSQVRRMYDAGTMCI